MVGTPDLQPSHITGDRFDTDVKPQMVLAPFIMLVHRQKRHDSCGIKFATLESLAFAPTDFVRLHLMQDLEDFPSVRVGLDAMQQERTHASPLTRLL